MENKQVLGKGLSEKIAVYVPSTQYDRPLPESEYQRYVTQAKTLFSQLFGGATAIEADGSWVSNGQLITEKITIVYSYSDEFSEDQLDAVKQFAKQLLRELEQDAISIEYSRNGIQSLIFIA